jgi:hypothetical protein
MVVTFLSMMIDPAAGNIAPDDQPQALQEVQGAVDGGLVYAGYPVF